ncbi:hypothetical protein NXC24_PC00708 (plasmid) [Rhizobium sp. NXC24]|nr:hypothetical protein NXC24_PC00708 [Rhizobium sp. NXC24]
MDVWRSEQSSEGLDWSYRFAIMLVGMRIEHLQKPVVPGALLIDLRITQLRLPKG